MRHLALFALLSLLALPLYAEEPTLEDQVSAFLKEADPQVRTQLALGLVARETDAAAVAAVLPGAWTWDEDVDVGDVTDWMRDTPDGVTHTIFAYAPEAYTPEKAWPVLLWLHGGVSRDQDYGGRNGVEMFQELAEEKGFLILSPSTQNGAFWWEPAGTALIRGSLLDLKRRYRVDADRVCVAGFSDGASGAYHLLMHDPEPYACFLAFMGNPLVSRSMGGPTWTPNLSSRPVYAVNGGTDRLYPSEAMQPFFEEMKEAGLDLTWFNEAEVGHSLSFLEERWEEAYAFWMDHPRETSPKEVTWCTSRPEGEGRNAWLEITAVSAEAGAAEGVEAPAELALPDTRRPRLGFRLDMTFAGPGILVEDVEEGTPAADAGLQVGDVILKAGDMEIANAEAIGVLREYLDALDGEQGVFIVKRGDEEIEMLCAPKILDKDLPPRPAELGYDVPAGVATGKVLEGNVVEVETHGVQSIRIWLDTAIMDVGAPLTVRVNGKQVFDCKPRKRVACLLAQAAENGPGAPIYAGWLDFDVP